jgi:hypothetical protein
MQWTHARPTEPGLYYINHSTVQQTILELCQNEYENEEPSLSWEDPNQDEGWEYNELPDDCLYAGPLPATPSLKMPDMESIQFYHDIPITLDGDGPAQEEHCKKLICEFLGWEKFPHGFAVDVSIEDTSGDDMMGAEILLRLI